MISRSTALILGAGASNSYGFPVGRKLLTQICSQLRPENISSKQREILLDLGHDSKAIDEFWRALRHMDHNSVDFFLERNPKYLEIGKAAIAAALIPWENDESLFPPGLNESSHWYKYLVNSLDVESDEFSQNHLSVLTFNYDRSLEKYLVTVIQERRHCIVGDAFKLLDSIPIIHLYGSLGSLDVTQPSDQNYSPDLDPRKVKLAASSIKILHESQDVTPEFDDAARILEQAERIYFLGFGFNPTNVRRLRIFDTAWDSSRKMRQSVYATWAGMLQQEWQAVSKKILHGNDSEHSHPMTCGDFLRHYPLTE